MEVINYCLEIDSGNLYSMLKTKSDNSSLCTFSVNLYWWEKCTLTEADLAEDGNARDSIFLKFFYHENYLSEKNWLGRMRFSTEVFTGMEFVVNPFLQLINNNRNTLIFS